MPVVQENPNEADSPTKAALVLNAALSAVEEVIATQATATAATDDDSNDSLCMTGDIIGALAAGLCPPGGVTPSPPGTAGEDLTGGTLVQVPADSVLAELCIDETGLKLDFPEHNDIDDDQV